MIVVIIAGGSGTRLWPISMPNYPKHLLKLNGDSRSLLQRTYERSLELTDKIYIISEQGHITHIKEQLNELDESRFIVEPARRGTASCIIASLAYLSKIYQEDEPIIFLSADHYIRDLKGFKYSFRLASETSKEQNKIVLVGAEPTYPSTGFGYIKKNDQLNQDSPVFKVDSFKEKPDFETAKHYIESGNYLWNCGYFVGSIKTFIKTMQKYSIELFNNYNKLIESKNDFKKTYLSFKNSTIDYELIEKVEDLLVVPAAFDWADLGSFKDLHQTIGSDQKENNIYGDNIEIEEVENSYILNQDDKPLVVIGLDNVVVVNSKNGVLVTRTDLSQKVGEISKRINK